MTAKNENKISFPIDLVYMWVDGNDPVWRAKRQKYMPAAVSTSNQTTSEARWRNNDELRFSLRSVEMYAPWINHIYIITDNQRPEWLNTNHPKITVVDHTEILPADALPVFNSSAIESGIYKIPRLSEHFLIGNDDTFFASSVTPELFFKEDGRPIVRLNKFNRFTWVRRSNYTKMLWHMQELVEEKTGKMIPYAPHHNFDAYRKSDFEHCVLLHPEAWIKTAHSRFRQNDDMHRSFVSYYTIATKRAELRRIGPYNRICGFLNIVRATLMGRFAGDSRCIRVNKRDYDAVMRRYTPLMICMNDNERSTEADCQRMVDFLKRKYPNPSQFER